jgi:hypothetical protein
MADEKITVYIDITQMIAQKNNNYSLYLAKMVNGQYTVIWQSKGPVATVDNPTYEYNNDFAITVPSYQVNYGTLTEDSGSVSFTASGSPQAIDIGQTVELTNLGIFSAPENNGTPGQITIQNQLAGNPHAVLLDNQGNPIFVNVQSGMDIGTATITPIDTYQIWFDNYQETGTIIAHNVSNAATVTFSGGTTSKVISYNKQGSWQEGPLEQTLDLGGVEAGTDHPIIVTVLATFKYALTAAATTYLLYRLIDKFKSGLRPTLFKASVGGTKLTVEFQGPRNREIIKTLGLDKYDSAVNQALTAAKADKAPGLHNETWTLSEPAVSVSY